MINRTRFPRQGNPYEKRIEDLENQLTMYRKIVTILVNESPRRKPGENTPTISAEITAAELQKVGPGPLVIFNRAVGEDPATFGITVKDITGEGGA